MLSEQLDSSIPSRKEDRAAIVQQLDRLLQNPHFHKSKRFPVFLKFVVTEALAGRADNLKERTLGIEVFGKEPGYDTTDDPIVRVTAGEIRKRIAQYYQEPGHEHEIKLLLPPGSYVPQFCFPDVSPAVLADQVKSAPGSLEEAQPPARSHPRRVVPWKKFALAALLVSLAVASALLWQMFHAPAIQEF